VRKSRRVGLGARFPVGKRGATLVSANISKRSICSVPPGLPVGRVGPRGGGRPTVMLNPYQSESDRYGLLHDGYKNVVRVENMSLRKKDDLSICEYFITVWGAHNRNTRTCTSTSVSSYTSTCINTNCSMCRNNVFYTYVSEVEALVLVLVQVQLLLLVRI
jgi:hypothetical protein